MAVKLPDYATVEELEKAWRTLTESEETRAEILIHYASNYLRQIAANNGQDLDQRIDADDRGVLGENVEMVVVAAVQREMATPSEMAPDATNWSQSATPYSESMSFTSGTAGNLYFKTKELALLGLNSVSGKSQISILRGARGESE